MERKIRHENVSHFAGSHKKLRFSRDCANKWTDGWTGATTCIISLTSWSNERSLSGSYLYPFEMSDKNFYKLQYRKFSNRGATPYRGAPPLLTTSPLGFWTLLAISQPKIVRFSFCKKPLEGENVPPLMIAPP